MLPSTRCPPTRKKYAGTLFLLALFVGWYPGLLAAQGTFELRPPPFTATGALASPVQQFPSAIPPQAPRNVGLNAAPAENSLVGLRWAERQEPIPPGDPVIVGPPLATQGIGPLPVEIASSLEFGMPLEIEGCTSCATCGCGGDVCKERTHVGRFFCALYHAICCPDPCYQPRWVALSDAAFFTDAARPVTQSRFRWDAGRDLIFPDRAEYFWARSGGGGKGLAAIETGLDYHELTHYTEVAHGKFGAFTEIPYRSLDPEVNPHEAGFGDIVAGTKSMLLDSELIQLTFQMKFITPVGIPSKGLGTGHLSLEPSLIMGLNLSPISYLQAQVAEWIPIAGDNDYAGALLHYHFSYNRTLYGDPRRVHVIGTAEFNGWSFQDGAFSDPALGQFQGASNETYLSSGLGLRMVWCEKVDFGVGTAFALTSEHWASQLYRSELRIRF